MADDVVEQNQPRIRRTRYREELEYDLLITFLWVNKHVPSRLFPQLHNLLWLFSRLDDTERQRLLDEMRALGDQRFGAGKDGVNR